jgi:hypothetical protein
LQLFKRLGEKSVVSGISFLALLFSVFEGLYKAILRHQALFPEMLLTNK